MSLESVAVNHLIVWGKLFHSVGAKITNESYVILTWVFVHNHNTVKMFILPLEQHVFIPLQAGKSFSILAVCTLHTSKCILYLHVIMFLISHEDSMFFYWVLIISWCVYCLWSCTCVTAGSSPAQSTLAGPVDRVTQTSILTAACVSALQAIAPPRTCWRTFQRTSEQDIKYRRFCSTLQPHQGV